MICHFIDYLIRVNLSFFIVRAVVAPNPINAYDPVKIKAVLVTGRGDP
jgi:hypothetical protein